MRHQHKRSDDLPLPRYFAPPEFIDQPKRGRRNRRIIARRVEKAAPMGEFSPREFSLHATKGYRSARA